MKFGIISGIAILIMAGCDSSGVSDTNETIMASGVKTMAQTEPDTQEWGDFRAFFTGDTHGLKGALAGTADIKAGSQIHPPHRHADEEFLIVTAGSGTWHLNGKDYPAKAGDVLYSAPWDYHGVKAAPDSPLQFFVVKFSAKGVKPAVDPDPSLPEELSE